MFRILRFFDFRNFTNDENEKIERERLEQNTDQIHQRLTKMLEQISVSNQNQSHTKSSDISKTLDLLEHEVHGQSEEIRNLNMDRLALTRVLAKLRLLEN